MTTMDDHRSKRSIIRRVPTLLLVVVAIGSVPALWLIGRDMISLQLASTPDQRRVRESAIIDGLLHEVDRAEAMESEGNLILSSTSISQPCYTIQLSSVQKNEQFLPSSISRGTDYDINYQIIAVRVAAESYIRDDARYMDAIEKFTSLQASALRACIAASPFRDRCLAQTTHILGRSTERFNQRTVAFGLQIPIRSTPGDRYQRYCSALPMFVEPDPE